MRGWLVAILAIATVAVGCSRDHAPAGKWQGSYSGDDAIIVARVEVQPDGKVRVSAPDAFADFTVMDPGEKLAVEQNLRAGLAASWSKVAPRAFDYDGRIFRVPGGVAPQLRYDASTRHMTMYIYPGSKPTIRIDMEPVGQFSD